MMVAVYLVKKYRNHRLVSFAMPEHLGLPVREQFTKNERILVFPQMLKTVGEKYLFAVSFHDTTDSLSKCCDSFISLSCFFWHKTGVRVLTYHVVQLSDSSS